MQMYEFFLNDKYYLNVLMWECENVLMCKFVKA